MHPLSNARTQGVRFPENQSTESAPTMKVTNVARGEIAFIEYGDERGIRQQDLVFIFGGKVFVPPQHTQWTAGFRSMVEAISKQVIEHLEVKATAVNPTVPSEDTVDVLSGTPAPVAPKAPPARESSLVDVFEKPKVK